MRDLLLIDYFKKLSAGERWIVFYFAISLILVIGVSDGAPVLFMCAAVANLGNAVRLLKRVTPPEE